MEGDHERNSPEAPCLSFDLAPMPSTGDEFKDEQMSLAIGAFRVEAAGYGGFIATKTPSEWPSSTLPNGVNVISLHPQELLVAISTAEHFPIYIIMVDPLPKEVNLAVGKLTKQIYGKDSLIVIWICHEERQVLTHADIIYRSFRKTGPNLFRQITRVWKGNPFYIKGKIGQRHLAIAILLKQQSVPNCSFQLCQTSNAQVATCTFGRGLKEHAEQWLEKVGNLSHNPIIYGYSPWDNKIAQYNAFLFDDEETAAAGRILSHHGLAALLKEAKHGELSTADAHVQIFCTLAHDSSVIWQLKDNRDNTIELICAFALQHQIEWRMMGRNVIEIRTSDTLWQELRIAALRSSITIPDSMLDQAFAWSSERDSSEGLTSK